MISAVFLTSNLLQIYPLPDLPPSKVHSHYPSPIGSSILEVITKGFYLLLYSIALGTISLSLLRLLFSKSL